MGIEIHTGTKIKASVVVSSLDPQTTFLKLVGEDKLPLTIKSAILVLLGKFKPQDDYLTINKPEVLNN